MEVYRYFLRTFGRAPGYWVGWAGELVKITALRIIATVIISQVAAAITAGDFEAAKRHALTFLALHVGASILGTITTLVAVRSQNTTHNDVRMTFYKKITGKDLSFYRDNHTGYLTSAFRQHLDGLMIFGRLLRTRVVQVLVSVIAPIIILGSNDWKLGLIILVIVLVQLGYIYWASAQVNKYRARTHEIYRKLTGEVADEITNIVAFKSSGQQAQSRQKVAQLGLEETDAYWRRHRSTTILDLPRNIITATAVTAALFVLLSQPSSSPAFIGLAVMTIMFLFQIMRHVSELPMLMTELDDLVTQIHPTLRYLGAEHEAIADPKKPKKLRVTKGKITLSKVGFSYVTASSGHKEIPVFDGLDLTINGGEHVGIVGLSGAGKSTLASLLLRFDDVKSGAITIDGTDIRHVRQEELRKAVAYVPQEPLLFHRTIRENIAYFQKNASDAAIIKAAKAAHAHEFIAKLPQGYDTMVGERGIKLSGGQKQRIVIARAILKNAPIMIFDEATSALDSESEQIIQSAMPKIIGKHTAIVIAHRLSTVAGLDRIIVLHNGKIVEQGTHDDLLKLGGRYAKLWQRQAATD